MRKKILIVEDDPDYAQTLAEFIQNAGGDVQIALGVDGAKKLAAQQAGFDHVICDSLTDGTITAWQRVREMFASPFTLLTANKNLVAQALEEGINAQAKQDGFMTIITKLFKTD